MKKLKPKALLKVPLDVNFEVGRSKRNIEEILNFKKGLTIKLDNSKKDVIQVYINGKRQGSGSVLRKSGHMFIEINELLLK